MHLQVPNMLSAASKLSLVVGSSSASMGYDGGSAWSVKRQVGTMRQLFSTTAWLRGRREGVGGIHDPDYGTYLLTLVVPRSKQHLPLHCG